MTQAYVLGQITVKDEAAWAEYRSQVPSTLVPWGAELVLRGQQVQVLAGACPHADVVLIRFPDVAAASGWHASEVYQALIPLRTRAVDLALLIYEA